MNLSLDQPTNALYQKYIVPQLRPGETVLFCAQWQAAKYVLVAIIAVLLAGLAILDTYYDYYIYETVQEACGNASWSGCGKFYEGSAWVVLVGGAATLFGLVIIVAVVLGWHKELHAITNERVITCRIGFLRGFDTIELGHLTYRNGWFVLNIKHRGLEMSFFLDRSARDSAVACLAAAKEGLRK
jgi:hypothetical protein